MQYNSIPVFSNFHLLEELKKLQSVDHVRSLIFLNCGGIIDHSTQWYYDEKNKIQAFIFDSHRPFHHNNIIDLKRKVFIVHDGCHSFDKYPTLEDVEFLQEFGEDDEDEDEEDDEALDSDDSERAEAKEELEDLKDDDDEELSGEDVVGEEDVDGEVKVGSKRHRE